MAQKITNKEILHQIIKGMDAYLSCGVPDPYWELAKNLTLEVYGEAGVTILDSDHITYDGAVDSRDEIILHTFGDWEEVIVKLEQLIEFKQHRL